MNPRRVQTGDIAAAPRLANGLKASLAGCFLLWAAHVWFYRFLCDDAFISFRYARNFARGFGLVFNPGYERVEGYTNFLWVVILAAGDVLGIEPHQLANPLSVLCGLALILLVLRFCLRQRLEGASAAWVVFPALMLATNRSFAVWCTSGLETKLFELLIVAGVLATLSEMRAMAVGDAKRFPVSTLLLAAACLTRPDGLLIAAAVMGTRVLYQTYRGTAYLPPLLQGVACFCLPVGAHFLFRRAYYGDWLPNTYYAKVGPSWWDMGGLYLGAFALEYGMIVWLPLIVMGVGALIRAGRAETPLILLAATAPHLLYLASIGGDHFEYRPLDVHLPFLFMLMYYGAASAAHAWRRRWILPTYLALCVSSNVALPLLSHLDFEPGYRPGFPGATRRMRSSSDLIDSTERRRLFALPVLGSYVSLYNELASRTTRHFVGVRQEEHRMFLDLVRQQGLWLADLVRTRKLPKDFHIAIHCVGAIPYFSNLRTLDRLGLTDREVARLPIRPGDERMLAHEKLAEPDHARARGVDFWSADYVHPILPARHPRYLFLSQMVKHADYLPIAAEVGQGRFLVGFMMTETIREFLQRAPGLSFLPVDRMMADELNREGEHFLPVPPEQQFGPPYDVIYVQQAHALAEYDNLDEIQMHIDRALATNPKNQDAIYYSEKLKEFRALRAGGAPRSADASPTGP